MGSNGITRKNVNGFGYNRMNQLELAIITATKFHSGVMDKTGTCLYIFHPLRVMDMARYLGLDDEAQQIAVMHDLVEDTDCTLNHLRSLGFSERVVNGVDALTRRNKKNAVVEEVYNPLGPAYYDRITEESYFGFVKRAAENLDARKLKPLDNADNMRPDRAVEGLKLGGRYKKSIGICMNACIEAGEQDYVDRFNRLVTWA
jgi:(p)ppGpp synthase/HD superfamily hydrolase